MKTKVICAFIVSIFLMAGCDGGPSSAGSRSSKIEYSDKVAAGTVADYTNADWLYQNYFGDYGLPEEVKPSFLPALQMLANGFVMQLKTGQDVKKNIEQVHSMFLHYVASGEAAKFFAQVHSNIQNKEIKITKQVEVINNPNFIEPLISDEDRRAIEEAKQRDLEQELEIKKLAEQYELPYKLTQYKEQWFIYSPAMKGSGKIGGGWGLKSKQNLPELNKDVMTH